ncbi:hypothetical protein F3Y22_tig00112738pilonHSYRG01184 [Hibiscus syriacus]|uniref:Vacuolar iron transporter n=1 Tax=Hibiscus syriacus TaxID=106335 RepID=A0A6A2XSF7_HIBSY|nr:uncharacterized protein LOC120183111 [Hibiscus syriacus]KAE8664946.1 hypothetical protein F3Y22_tig00112738pilonHSYRG01184 [Hibiscus syriacus]
MSEITVDTNSTVLEEYEVRDKKGRPNDVWNGEVDKSIVYAGMEAIFTCFSLISYVSASRFSSVICRGRIGVWHCEPGCRWNIIKPWRHFVYCHKERLSCQGNGSDRVGELNNHGKQQQLLQQYQNLGMNVNDAKTIFAKYNDIMRDQKMTAEKGVMSPDQVEQTPWKNGVVTFVAFVGFGSAPLSSFIKPFTNNEWVMFVGASFMSSIALTSLGIRLVAKAKQCWWVWSF